MSKSIQDVKSFWENHPLFEGEAVYETGTEAFFREHERVYVEDCFAGKMDERIFVGIPKTAKILDLGCGPGFWTLEFAKRGFSNIMAADLSSKSVRLAKKRCDIWGFDIGIKVENAMSLSFESESFDHVNCQGVIHHTPSPEECVREIARVLGPNGTATISVYYKNLILRSWPQIGFIGKVLTKLGGGLKGRGRESIFSIRDVNEIVRRYDGADNPIGVCYTNEEFKTLLEPYFEIEQMFLHFFPARSLPFSIGRRLHKYLNDRMGFLIIARLKKRATC